MSTYYRREELLALVPGLTSQRLVRLIESEVVVPVQQGEGEVFQPCDQARLALACELGDEFDMNEDAVGLVLSMIDQMHRARAELRALMQAVEAQPQDIRRAVGSVLEQRRATGR